MRQLRSLSMMLLTVSIMLPVQASAQNFPPPPPPPCHTPETIPFPNLGSGVTPVAVTTGDVFSWETSSQILNFCNDYRVSITLYTVEGVRRISGTGKRPPVIQANGDHSIELPLGNVPIDETFYAIITVHPDDGDSYKTFVGLFTKQS